MGENAKNVLFLVATNVIGKAKILMEISRRCKRKLHVGSRKMSVLSAWGWRKVGCLLWMNLRLMFKLLVGMFWVRLGHN